MQQGCLFPLSTLPEGFVYEPEFILPEEERALLAAFREVDFEPFQFHQYTAKRRIAAYGWDYDFSAEPGGDYGKREPTQGRPLPDFLLRLRERCAASIGVGGEELAEAVITEYPPGAPIGWHRDLPQFEEIVGVSLLNSCTMRLRPYKSSGKTCNIELEPRSLYVMSGRARWSYQHSIPPVKKLRYSITFRTMRKGWRVESRSA
jgi:alkylated DNA repair dioxygenase AlkB